MVFQRSEGSIVVQFDSVSKFKKYEWKFVRFTLRIHQVVQRSRFLGHNPAITPYILMHTRMPKRFETFSHIDTLDGEV